jgi:hypothetical protein
MYTLVWKDIYNKFLKPPALVISCFTVWRHKTLYSCHFKLIIFNSFVATQTVLLEIHTEEIILSRFYLVSTITEVFLLHNTNPVKCNFATILWIVALADITLWEHLLWNFLQQVLLETKHHMQILSLTLQFMLFHNTIQSHCVHKFIYCYKNGSAWIYGHFSGWK